MLEIDKLTKEQEQMLQVYEDKYVKIGLNTDRFDLNFATQIIHKFQKDILQVPITPVLLYDNPSQCNKVLYHIVSNNDIVDLDKISKLDLDTIEYGTGIYPYQDGSFYVDNFAKYSYYQDVLGVDLSEFKYKSWEDTMYLGLIYPLDNVCIVCQKPTQINLNEKHELHADGKPALSYAGGWNLWYLNGIEVPEELVMTPAGQLDLKLFHEIKNADIRAEFIRKYGIDRMVKLGTLVDSYKNYNDPWWTKSEYELYDMKNVFEGITKHDHCYYIKMRNLTTGIWHLEAIKSECNTLVKALSRREKINVNNYETLFIV